jgi:hypothetical protein
MRLANVCQKREKKIACWHFKTFNFLNLFEHSRKECRCYNSNNISRYILLKRVELRDNQGHLQSTISMTKHCYELSLLFFCNWRFGHTQGEAGPACFQTTKIPTPRFRSLKIWDTSLVTNTKLGKIYFLFNSLYFSAWMGCSSAAGEWVYTIISTAPHLPPEKQNQKPCQQRGHGNADSDKRKQ